MKINVSFENLMKINVISWIFNENWFLEYLIKLIVRMGRCFTNWTIIIPPRLFETQRYVSSNMILNNVEFSEERGWKQFFCQGKAFFN